MTKNRANSSSTQTDDIQVLLHEACVAGARARGVGKRRRCEELARIPRASGDRASYNTRARFHGCCAGYSNTLYIVPEKLETGYSVACMK